MYFKKQHKNYQKESTGYKHVTKIAFKKERYLGGGMCVSSSRYAATVRATPLSSAYNKIICVFTSES